jgi:hypothetical protein
VIVSAIGGTVFMISTWSEIPMALQLIQFRLQRPSGGAARRAARDQPAVYGAAQRIAASGSTWWRCCQQP